MYTWVGIVLGWPLRDYFLPQKLHGSLRNRLRWWLCRDWLSAYWLLRYTTLLVRDFDSILYSSSPPALLHVVEEQEDLEDYALPSHHQSYTHIAHLSWRFHYFSIGLSDLEIYFARSLGFSLAILAIIVLFFTGTIPLSSSITEPISLEDGDPKAPYAMPIVRVMTLFHVIGLVYCYVRYFESGLGGFFLGAFGYGLMAVNGCWYMLFGTGSGRVSKRTGKDKRMSGFPFKNVNEYDKRQDRKHVQWGYWREGRSFIKEYPSFQQIYLREPFDRFLSSSV